MALKAKKVTQGIREEGAEQDPKDHPDAWWALTGNRFPIVTPLKNETLMTTTIFKESTNWRKAIFENVSVSILLLVRYLENYKKYNFKQLPTRYIHIL